MGFEDLDWIRQYSINTAINLRVPLKENNFLIGDRLLASEEGFFQLTMSDLLVRLQWRIFERLKIINWKGCGTKLS